MATAAQEIYDEQERLAMEQARKNAAKLADRQPDTTSVPVGPSIEPVTVDAEINALRECVEALLPVSHDKAVLRRIYDYLQQRFPAPPARRDNF